jgi:hypothetical protein
MKLRSTFFEATVLLSILFALVVLLPHLLQRIDPGYPFEGVEILPSDAEPHYAARVREIMDGFPTAANVFYSAPKDQPYLQPALPEWVIAHIAHATGLPVMSAFLLAKILGALLLFLILTGFFQAVTHRQWEPLLAVSLLLFAGTLLGTPWDLLKWIRGAFDVTPVLRFARPINPLWTAPWFFGALWLVAAWLKQRKTGLMLLAGGSAAVLLYSYVYAWMYLGITVALLFLWFLWKGDRARTWDLLLFAFVFLLLGLPYLGNLWEALHHPSYAETAARFGLIEKRTPIMGVWALLFLLLAPFLQRRWPWTRPLIPALALGGMLALNQHVITGQYLVPHHTHWYFLQPLASTFFLILLLSLLSPFLAHRPAILKVGGTILVLASLSFGILQQARAYKSLRHAWGELQMAAPVLRTLAREVRPGTVVAVTNRMLLRDLIAIYTSADLYSSNDANHYLIPLSVARERLFFHLWLEGVTPRAAETRFFGDLRRLLGARLHYLKYRELLGSYEAIPDEVLKEHLQAYREYVGRPLEEKLAGIHFLVFTPEDARTPMHRLLERRARLLLRLSGGYTIAFL